MLLSCLFCLAQTIDVHTDVPTWYTYSPANPGVDLRFAGRLGPDLLLRARTGLGSNPPGTGTAAVKDSLWLSDGSAAGTIPIAQVGSTAPDSLLFTIDSASLPNGDQVVFLDSQNTGLEPFVVDQASGTVQLLEDIVPGQAGLFPKSVVPFGGKVWMSFNNGPGTGFFETDGTPLGTSEVVFPVQSALVEAPEFIPAGPRLFATGHLGHLFVKDSAGAPWKSLPWPAGVELLSPLGGLDDGRLILLGGTSATGAEPWVTDGTPAGTSALADIFSGPSSSQVRFMANSGDKLYFSASSPSTAREPWVTDGTLAGTFLLRDVGPGMAPGIDSFKNNTQAVAFPGGMYFTAYDLDDSLGMLWFTDGTQAGTERVSGAVAAGAPTGLYVQAWRLHWSGTELFAYTDMNNVILSHVPGAAQPVQVSTGVAVAEWLGEFGGATLFRQSQFPRVHQIQGGSLSTAFTIEEILTSDHSAPEHIERSGLQGRFIADDGPSGRELRRIDASNGLPDFTYEIHNGVLDSEPDAPFGETPLGLVFAASDNFFGRELRLGGEPAQSFPLLEIAAGQASTTFGAGGAQLDGIVLFSVLAPADQAGVWRSDGTPGGTSRLLASDTPTEFLKDQHARFGGRVWFASDGALVSTDGVQVTTHASSAPVLPTGALLLALDDVLLFEAGIDGPSTSSGLYATDGTAAGTTLVRDFAPGPDSAQLRDLQRLGDLAILRATDETHGEEVWTTDGTPSGTSILLDAVPGSAGEILDLVVATDQAFFLSRANDLSTPDLWSSDGTSAGTQVVSSGDPRVGGLIATELVPLARGVVGFAGLTPEQGTEPWISDGTAAGTRLLADTLPGPRSGFPTQFARIGRFVFCDVLHPELGRELFRLPFTDLDADTADPIGFGCGAILTASGGAASQGETLHVQLADLEPTVPAALLAAAPSTSLPVGEGCLSYVGASPLVLTLGTSTAEGRLDVPLSLANNPSLVGQRVILQALAVQVPGPVFGFFELSNALDLVIGS